MRPALNKSKREMLRRLNDQVERARSFAVYLLRNMEEVNEKADMKAVLEDLKSARLILDKITPQLERLWSDKALVSAANEAELGVSREELLDALEKVLGEKRRK